MEYLPLTTYYYHQKSPDVKIKTAHFIKIQTNETLWQSSKRTRLFNMSMERYLVEMDSQSQKRTTSVKGNKNYEIII